MDFSKSAYEAKLLEKYSDIFPHGFIQCVKSGVTWLANHNGISYHTSVMVATDGVVYEQNKSSILRLGLINLEKPFTGLTYYEVRSIQELKDSVNGNTIFKVKLNYVSPIGIEITLIPINYFDPFSNGIDNYYTIQQVNELVQKEGSAQFEHAENIRVKLEEKLAENTALLEEMKIKVDNILTVIHDQIDAEVPGVSLIEKLASINTIAVNNSENLRNLEDRITAIEEGELSGDVCVDVSNLVSKPELAVFKSEVSSHIDEVKVELKSYTDNAVANKPQTETIPATPLVPSKPTEENGSSDSSTDTPPAKEEELPKEPVEVPEVDSGDSEGSKEESQDQVVSPGQDSSSQPQPDSQGDGTVSGDSSETVTESDASSTTSPDGTTSSTEGSVVTQ